MAGGPFPKKNTEVSDYFDVVTPYLNTHASRLSVSSDNLSALNDLYDKGGSTPQSEFGWSQIWVLYSNPATVNKTIRTIVKTRRKQIETILRIIYSDIPESAFTTNDRNTLKLPKRDSEPTTIQAVQFVPVLSFKSVSNGIQIVRFKNPETPESNAMPPNQRCEVKRYVGEAKLADKDVPFIHFGDTGKHLFKVEYKPKDKGKTAYYRARYKTRTGKVGPWSDVQSEIVL